MFTSTNEFDSLRSAHVSSHNPYKWFLSDKSNLFQPLVPGLSPDSINDPRQSYPQVYIPNGHVDIVRSSNVILNGKLHGDRMFVFVTPFTHEIDVPEDFEYLEYKINNGIISLD